MAGWKHGVLNTRNDGTCWICGKQKVTYVMTYLDTHPSVDWRGLQFGYCERHIIDWKRMPESSIESLTTDDDESASWD